jgi:hypothetical protein
MSRRPSMLVMFVLITWPHAACAGSTADDAMAQGRAMTAAVTQSCLRSDRADEITVCGRDGEHYRLPLPEEREPSENARLATGDVPRASAARLQRGPCGIFVGQRKCWKEESRAYGLGGGNDPASFLIKLGTALADPDADLAPPTPIPGSALRRSK